MFNYSYFLKLREIKYSKDYHLFNKFILSYFEIFDILSN